MSLPRISPKTVEHHVGHILKVFAPADCIVSNTSADNDHALQQIESVMKGNVTPSAQLTFRRDTRARARPVR
jgi:hypothetical protein